MKIEVDDARRRLRALNASLPMCLHAVSDVNAEEALRMIDAWAGVKPSYRRGWTLTIMGVSTSQSPRLARAARQFGVSSSMRLMPTLTKQDAAVLVAAADVVACPDGEGQPDAFTLEAMLQGKPTIIGDRPDVRGELHNATWFVDPQDTAAISRSLSRLLSDTLLRRELGRSGALRACSLSEKRPAAVVLDAASETRIARAA
ncbi:MAG: glycosyltransferase [Phycisphaeraceae bacterium]